MMSRRQKSLIKSIFLFLFTLLICFVAIEIAARWQQYAFLKNIYEKGYPASYFGAIPLDVNFSNVVDYRPGPERADYVALGDSTTYGHGLAAEEAYPHLLGNHLNQSILNRASPGANAGDIYLIYKDLGFQPKTMIYGYSYTDPEMSSINFFSDCGIREEEILGLTLFGKGMKSYHVFLLKVSWVLRNFAQSLHPSDQGGAYSDSIYLLGEKMYIAALHDDQYVGWICTERIFGNFKDVPSEKILFIFSLDDECSINDKIEDLASSNGFKVYDMPSYLSNKTAGFHDEDLFVSPTDRHLGAQMHVQIAKALADHIRAGEIAG
jgi:hypothetical protein